MDVEMRPKMRKPKVPFLLAFFLVCFAPASGQSDERAPKPSPAAVSAPASSAASPSAKTPGAGQAEINESEYPSVVAANNHVRTTTWAEVEGPVTIALQDFSQWAGRKKVDPNDLRLYLAGRMIPNLEPTMVVWSQEYVNFDLKLTPREILVAILTAARRAKNHSIPMSIGLKDEKQPFPSERFLILQVYPKWAPFCWAGLAALIVVLVLLGWRTTMLRDTLAAGPPLKAPFSLARFQMVCWFAVVVVAYLYIWALTGEYNAPTGSVLALIGISSATGLAAIVLWRFPEVTLPCSPEMTHPVG